MRELAQAIWLEIIYRDYLMMHDHKDTKARKKHFVRLWQETITEHQT